MSHIPYNKLINNNIPSSNIPFIKRIPNIPLLSVGGVINMPGKGVYTGGAMVGERGVTLSGGQKQRTAIAQMLIRKPEIMIFDDSLSAVDAKTDSIIRKGLKKASKDATVIIISHRITTIMGADNIYVFDGGKVIESGNHDELVSKNGVYNKIFNMQRSVDEEE